MPLCRCALGLECPLLLLKVNVTQSCPTLCDPVDCSVHGILQVRILEWVAVPTPVGSCSPRFLPNSGIEPRSPILQADSLVGVLVPTWYNKGGRFCVPQLRPGWILEKEENSKKPLLLTSQSFQSFQNPHVCSLLRVLTELHIHTNLTMDLGKSFVFVYVCECVFFNLC